MTRSEQESESKNKGKKCAFTLAEVLITLGIIGVVAALTLPTLIQNYKKSQTSTKLKKFYSTMTQAVLMSENDNGSAMDWAKEGGLFGDITNEDGDVDYNANYMVIKNWFNKYLAPYLQESSIEPNVDKKPGYEAILTLHDGSTVYLHNGACIDIMYDVNGEKNPNTLGSDVYFFIMCTAEKCEQAKDYLNCGKFAPYGVVKGNRTELLSECKTNPQMCTKLLMTDNWEFQDDYPYKL